MKAKPAALGNGLFCEVPPHVCGNAQMGRLENDGFMEREETINSLIEIGRERRGIGTTHQIVIGLQKRVRLQKVGRGTRVKKLRYS